MKFLNVYILIKQKNWLEQLNYIFLSARTKIELAWWLKIVPKLQFWPTVPMNIIILSVSDLNTIPHIYI